MIDMIWLQRVKKQANCFECTDFQVFIGAFERSTTIHQRQWGKSLSTFHCFMRKQNTKIHTDFELSVCRLHQSVFKPVQYAALRYRLHLLPRPLPPPARLRWYLIIAPSVSVAYLAQSLFLLSLPRLSVVTKLIRPLYPHRREALEQLARPYDERWKNIMTRAGIEMEWTFFVFLLVCVSLSFSFRPSTCMEYNHCSLSW